MTKKRISVIIPVYNEENDILECLYSLDKQVQVSFEVIVVDDGSKDQTVDLINSFHPNRYSLKLLQQDHMGAGSARNYGAKNAKHQVLVFVDSDMTFEKRFLKQLTSPIFSGIAKGTTSTSEFVSNWDNVWARCLNIQEGWQNRRRHKKGHKELKVFRAILKKEYERAGGYTPGGYTDDWSLSERLGYEPVDTPKAIFYHKNPSTLVEIFSHAQWVSRRRYKFGVFGTVYALLRSCILISLLIGGIKSLVTKTPQFLLYKIVYDFGCTIGILRYSITKRGAK